MVSNFDQLTCMSQTRDTKIYLFLIIGHESEQLMLDFSYLGEQFIADVEISQSKYISSPPIPESISIHSDASLISGRAGVPEIMVSIPLQRNSLGCYTMHILRAMLRHVSWYTMEMPAFPASDELLSSVTKTRILLLSPSLRMSFYRNNHHKIQHH